MKFTQITGAGSVLFGLDADGQVWERCEMVKLHPMTGQAQRVAEYWRPVAMIDQEEAKRQQEEERDRRKAEAAAKDAPSATTPYRGAP